MEALLQVNEYFVKLGDNITYTLTLKNDETASQHIYVLPSLIPEIVYEEAFINRQIIESINVGRDGIQLIKLQPFEQVELQFSGRLEDFPVENPITQMIDIRYEKKANSYTTESNEVITYVKDSNLNEKCKSCYVTTNVQVADLDTIITYQVLLENKGNIKADDICLLKGIPKGTCFIEGSIRSCESREVIYEADCFQIGNMAINEGISFSYAVKVESIPYEWQITWEGEIVYKMKWPNRKVISQKVGLNKLQTPIQTASFQLEEGYLKKEVSAQIATEGDILTYHIKALQWGNQAATHIYIKDYVPCGTVWVPESLVINGVGQKESKIEDGIFIPQINPGENLEITYAVHVAEQVEVGEVVATSMQLGYSYNLEGEIVQKQICSSTPVTKIRSAHITSIAPNLLMGIKKSVTLEEDFTGYIAFKNKGNEVARGIDVCITIPSGFMIYDGESVILNTYEISITSLAPQAVYKKEIKFHVNALGEEVENTITTAITYRYEVTPARSEQVNIVEKQTVKVEGALISFALGTSKKTFSHKALPIGGKLKCQLELVNSGNVLAKNICIKEQLPEILSFSNDFHGTFFIESLMPAERVALFYEGEVIDLSETALFKSQTLLKYEYITSAGEIFEKEEACEGEGVQIQDGRLNTYKSTEVMQKTDQKCVAVGDHIHYSLQLKHLGNVKTEEIYLRLPLVKEARWTSKNPIIVNSLTPGESALLAYDLEVLSQPQTGKIMFSPTLNYAFMVEGQKIVREDAIETTQVQVESAFLSELDGGIVRTSEKQTISIDENAVVHITIKNTGNINATNIVWQEEINECDYEIDGCVKDKMHVKKLGPGEAINLSYHIKVHKMPINEMISTKTRLNYEYKVGGNIKKQETISSPLEIKVEDPVIKLQPGRFSNTQMEVVLGEPFPMQWHIESLGNVDACNLYFMLEAEGITFEPALERVPLQVETLVHKKAITIETIGKIESLMDLNRARVRGKVYYEFASGHEKKEHVVYSTMQEVMVVVAGPLSEEAFTVQLDKKVLHVDEPIKIICQLKNEGNTTMAGARLALEGFKAYGFKITDVVCESYAINVIEDMFEIGDIPRNTKVTIEIKGYCTQIGTKEGKLMGQIYYSYSRPLSHTIKKLCKEAQPQSFTLQDSGLSLEAGRSLQGKKQRVGLGEEEEFLLTLSNIGNVATHNIRVKLDMGGQLKYVAGSLSDTAQNMEKGICIDEIKPMAVYEVLFKAKVLALFPNSETIVTGTVIYEYEDGSGKVKVCEKTIASNVIYLQGVDLSQSDVILSQQEIMLGEGCTYEVICKNTGNIEAENVGVKLSLPQGIKCTSHTLENIIPLGKLPPMVTKSLKLALEGDMLTVEEKGMIIAELQYYEEDTKRVFILPDKKCECMQASVEAKLSANENCAIVGEKVHYVLTLYNKGNKMADKVRLSEFIPKEISLIEGKEMDLVLAPGEKKKVKLEGKVLCRLAQKEVAHKVKLSYEFNVNNQLKNESIWSSPEVLAVEESKLEIYQKCLPSKVGVGEEIELTVKFINTGTLPLDQIIFYEHLPKGTCFVEGSFKKEQGSMVNIVNIEEGIGLGPLEIGSQLTIYFKVRVKQYVQRLIKQCVYGHYLFNKEGLQISKGKTEEIVEEIEVNSPYKISLPVETNIFLPYDVLDFYEILRVEVSGLLLEANLVAKGQLGIKGLISYKVFYKDIKGKEEQLNIQKVFGNTVVSNKMTYDEVTAALEIGEVKYTLINKRALKVQVQLMIYET